MISSKISPPYQIKTVSSPWTREELGPPDIGTPPIRHHRRASFPADRFLRAFFTSFEVGSALRFRSSFISHPLIPVTQFPDRFHLFPRGTPSGFLHLLADTQVDLALQLMIPISKGFSKFFQSFQGSKALRIACLSPTFSYADITSAPVLDLHRHSSYSSLWLFFAALTYLQTD